MKYCLIATEGHHDQAIVSRIFHNRGYSEFTGAVNTLDPFWKVFIPKYPVDNDLYKRVSFPTIVQNATHSVAIYLGDGSKLKQNLAQLFSAHKPFRTELNAFGIVLDSDQNGSEKIVKEWQRQLSGVLTHFPTEVGISKEKKPKIGFHIVPTNSSGVIDSVMCSCGPHAYPELWPSAQVFVSSARDKYSSHWKPFDEHKALTAAVVSILRPSATNTVSYKKDTWISDLTIAEVPELNHLTSFLIDLIESDP